MEAQEQKYHEQRSKLILDHLGLTTKDLEGKKVLDLGSGESSLSAFTADKNIDIVSLDIKTKRKPTIVLPNTGNKEAMVQAEMEKLPFADSSFDLIVAHASGATEVFIDSVRTLKPDGEIRQYPMYGAENWFIYYHLWQNIRMEQEEVEEKISRLTTEQGNEYGLETEEYTNLLNEALEMLNKDEKLYILEQLKNQWEEIIGVPLELYVSNPDDKEPRGTIIYKKPLDK